MIDTVKITMTIVAGTKSDNPLLALLLASLGGAQVGDYLILSDKNATQKLQILRNFNLIIRDRNPTQKLQILRTST